MARRKPRVWRLGERTRERDGAQGPNGSKPKKAAGRKSGVPPQAYKASNTIVHQYRDDEPSLIGGMKASSIRAHTYAMSVQPRELTEEERRKKWQPPVRDTSRFSGTSSSRHHGTPSFNQPWDGLESSLFAADNMGPTLKHRAAEVRKRKAKEKAEGKAGKKAKSAQSAKALAINSPLNVKQLRALDYAYRVHGADPKWEGWAKLVSGRTPEFLLAIARRCHLDTPDDKRWTKGEKTVFKKYRVRLEPDSARWRTLLPRKSAIAIARRYQSDGK